MGLEQAGRGGGLDGHLDLARMKPDHRLSRLCQQAVDLEADMLDLPDGLRDDALEAAAASFFDEWAVAGSYAICQDELVQHEATSTEMSLDAESLGIPTGKLIPALQELFDLEKEYALRKAAVLRKYRSGKNVRQI